MTLADLGRKCVRRNPLIADLLHRIDFIEKAGTGIRRIRDEVRTWGGPAPLFETSGCFTTTIYPIANVLTQMAIISESESGGPVKGPVKGPVGGPVGGPVNSGSCGSKCARARGNFRQRAFTTGTHSGA
jgi:hypothetical protein